MKTLSLSILTALFLFCTLCISQAAAPFNAPANFDLNGSTVSLVCTFESLRGESIVASLDPNPVPVTGNIHISTLQKSSGVFTGEFQNVSGSTTLSAIPGLGDLSINLAINSMTKGMFLWSQDKVVFNAESIDVVFTIGSQQFPVNLKGMVIPASYTDGTITLQLDVSKSGTYGSFDFSIDADILLSGRVQPVSTDGTPWLEFSSSQTLFSANEVFDLYASLGAASTITADLYVGLIKPSGELLLLAPDFTFTSDLVPVLSNFTLTPDLNISNLRVFQTPLPASSPPIDTTGEYTFIGLYTQPGTLEFIGEITDLLSFIYSTDETSSGTGYDGTYTGNAQTSTPSQECAPLASLAFTIRQNQLSGTAEEEGLDEGDSYQATAMVDDMGHIVEGVIWEEYVTSLIPIGSFDGSISGNIITGSWTDAYGCYGIYSLSKQ